MNWLNEFKCWCAKVLPLVYDDSLSYYEVLCKLTKVMNDVVAWLKQLPDYIRGVVATEVLKFSDSRAGTPWIASSRRLYVDGVNGSDTNDGETPSTAFKTLDRFIQVTNAWKTDIRCYILAAGTYEWHVQAATGISIHVTNRSDGEVIVMPTAEATTAFYNCRLNIDGVTIKAENIPHCDGGYWTFTNCVINGFNFYGGSVRLNNCKLLGVYFAHSKVYLNGCTFGDVGDAPSVTGLNSIICVEGNDTGVENPAYNRAHPMIKLDSCTIGIYATVDTSGLTNKYAQAIACTNGCTVKGSQSRLSNFLGAGSGQYFHTSQYFQENQCDDLYAVWTVNTYLTLPELPDDCAFYKYVDIYYRTDTYKVVTCLLSFVASRSFVLNELVISGGQTYHAKSVVKFANNVASITECSTGVIGSNVRTNKNNEDADTTYIKIVGLRFHN